MILLSKKVTCVHILYPLMLINLYTSWLITKHTIFILKNQIKINKPERARELCEEMQN